MFEDLQGWKKKKKLKLHRVYIMMKIQWLSQDHLWGSFLGGGIARNREFYVKYILLYYLLYQKRNKKYQSRVA